MKKQITIRLKDTDLANVRLDTTQPKFNMIFLGGIKCLVKHHRTPNGTIFHAHCELYLPMQQLLLNKVVGDRKFAISCR